MQKTVILTNLLAMMFLVRIVCNIFINENSPIADDLRPQMMTRHLHLIPELTRAGFKGGGQGARAPGPPPTEGPPPNPSYYF